MPSRLLWRCLQQPLLPPRAAQAESVAGNPGTVAIDTADQGNGDVGHRHHRNVSGVYANNFGTTLPASRPTPTTMLPIGGPSVRQGYGGGYEGQPVQVRRPQRCDKQGRRSNSSGDCRRSAQLAEINAAIAKAGADATKAWTDAAKAYNKAVGNFANINGNEVINTFELQGDNVGGMTVTIVLDKSKYAGHTVTALILDENGKTIQKTLVVDKNGCIKIEKDGFCVWTLVDCSGGLPASAASERRPAGRLREGSERPVATDKGTSPKTGC